MRACRDRESGDEVLGLRMVTDDGGGRLFRVVLETLTDLDTDLFCTQQPGHREVVFQIRAGGIPPRVPAAAVLLAEQTGQRWTIFIRVPHLLTDAAVPQLS